MAQTGALVTGEAVALDLRLAGLPSRLLARLVDAAAQLLLALAVLPAALRLGAASSDAAVAALTVTGLVLVVVGYPVVLETLSGRTLGKLALGLRVVRDDGGPIGFWQALVRGIAGLIDLITSFVPSVVVMLLHPRSKRLGDLVAGTVVVQERVAARGGTVAQMPPPLAGWAQGLRLEGLPDDLALSVRAFLGRSDELTAEAREDLGSRLVAAVAATTSPPPPPGTPGWAYLSAVLAERRRREQARLAPPPPAYGQQQYAQQYGPQHRQQYGQQQYGQQYAPQQYGPQYAPQQYGQPQPQPPPPPGDAAAAAGASGTSGAPYGQQRPAPGEQDPARPRFAPPA